MKWHKKYYVSLFFNEFCSLSNNTLAFLIYMIINKENNGNLESGKEQECPKI